MSAVFHSTTANKPCHQPGQLWLFSNSIIEYYIHFKVHNWLSQWCEGVKLDFISFFFSPMCIEHLQKYHTIYNKCSVSSSPRYDDVVKWKHFLRYWPFVRSPVDSPQGPVTRNFDIFFDPLLNKRLRTIETPAIWDATKTNLCNCGWSSQMTMIIIRIIVFMCDYSN